MLQGITAQSDFGTSISSLMIGHNFIYHTHYKKLSPIYLCRTNCLNILKAIGHLNTNMEAKLMVTWISAGPFALRIGLIGLTGMIVCIKNHVVTGRRRHINRLW